MFTCFTPLPHKRNLHPNKKFRDGTSHYIFTSSQNNLEPKDTSPHSTINSHFSKKYKAEFVFKFSFFSSHFSFKLSIWVDFLDNKNTHQLKANGFLHSTGKELVQHTKAHSTFINNFLFVSSNNICKTDRLFTLIYFHFILSFSIWGKMST